MLPEGLTRDLELYVEEGVHPGGFLRAVLANDLYATFNKADRVNVNRIEDIVQYVLRYVPFGACGSYEVVDQWIRSGGRKKMLGGVS